MKKTKEIIEMLHNPEKYIPYGFYCYFGTRGPGDPNYKRCAFWDYDPTKHEQENGYCYFLGEGDWECDGIGLLWDQCKECGINESFEEDEI